MVCFAPDVAVTFRIRETESVYASPSPSPVPDPFEDCDALEELEAHWLAYSTGIDLGTAREKVRAARALVELPRIGAAMSRGELSFSAVRALTRVATPETEGDLLELARGCTIAQLERVVRAYRLGSRQDEATPERERFDSRTLSVFPDDDGMYVVKGKLTPEVGALLMRPVPRKGLQKRFT